MKLLDVCEFIVDCPHSTAPDEGEGYPLIRTPNIGRGRLKLDNVHRVSKDVYDKRNKRAVPQVDDIIFAREAPAGNAAIICDGQKVCLGQRTVLIRPDKNKVYPQYLVYYILAPQQQYELLGTANGATVAHVNIPVIKNLSIQLPEMDKQIKIANTISSYEDLIENNQKQIKLLEEAAQRLYKEWFVDLRFPGYEDVAIVDGVPEGWKKETLIDIADVIMGQSPKSEFYNTHREGLPFHQGVRSYGRRFVNDDVYSTSYTRIAEKNSILFSIRAPVGRLNITKNKIVIGRGLAAMKHKLGYQSYLFHMLKERFFKDNLVGNGAIFASITKNELLNQTFINPNEELIRKFNEIAKNVDDKINVLDSQTELLKQARDRLLPKMMNGEIEV
ncbi:restriction endonuclease subunit S [Zhenpiania hominis]|uniref:Restriction endonuclease subunit S n=1 Tax=Zhenpiania hominis TaxID=2763644 RepID=A0A923NPH7_9FIRM|nr:restriction endonuclease subunit S [Zhenpiania hominis]MBC6680330.1 restriction endonuclease subunit S [Zhenpiania hominis]